VNSGMLRLVRDGHSRAPRFKVLYKKQYIVQILFDTEMGCAMVRGWGVGSRTAVARNGGRAGSLA
jgi:hypothetical protein